MAEKSLQQLCKEFFESISLGTLQQFCTEHQEEVAQGYRVMLMKSPEIVHLYAESTLRQMVLMYLWHKKNGGEDWWRPRKPTPEPPLPLGGNTRRVLEPA